MKKSKSNQNYFNAHCVDSWALANSIVGGHTKPDNKLILFIRPLKFFRRQLHYFLPSKENKRRNYGGTRSLGLKRGSLVLHPKYGVCYVGGTQIKHNNERIHERVSLHSMDGERVSRYIQVSHCRFLCYNSWTIQDNKNEKN